MRCRRIYGGNGDRRILTGCKVFDRSGEHRVGTPDRADRVAAYIHDYQSHAAVVGAPHPDDAGIDADNSVGRGRKQGDDRRNIVGDRGVIGEMNSERTFIRGRSAIGRDELDYIPHGGA